MLELDLDPPEDPDFESKETWKKSNKEEMMFEYLQSLDKDRLVEMIHNSSEYQLLICNVGFYTFLDTKCEEAFEPDPDRAYDESRDQ